jgi:hypothetical protein
MMGKQRENRQVVLLGNRDTKRTIYFEHAARKAGLHVFMAEWKNWEQLLGERSAQERLIKIDPPVWDSCNLEELNRLTKDYQEKLTRLSIQAAKPVQFLNSPEGILELLDKRICKNRLSDAKIPVTEPVCQSAAKLPIPNADCLLEIMDSQKVFQVFIKPVKGSGAAGTAAFRFHPKTGRMVLYTAAFIHPDSGCLINTKKLRCFSENRMGKMENQKNSQILSLLDRLLALDCIVERWYAKEEYDGCSFDLRAVVQDGCLDFLLARLSNGPITNLHLNNHPLMASQLNLPLTVMEQIEDLCQRASGCCQGIRSIGIDILLEKRSLKPRIIEMNGQGDLIYQDIYQENRIYLHQAQMMKAWLNEC